MCPASDHAGDRNAFPVGVFSLRRRRRGVGHNNWRAVVGAVDEIVFSVSRGHRSIDIFPRCMCSIIRRCTPCRGQPRLVAVLVAHMSDRCIRVVFIQQKNGLPAAFFVEIVDGASEISSSMLPSAFCEWAVSRWSACDLAEARLLVGSSLSCLARSSRGAKLLFELWIGRIVAVLRLSRR